MPKFVQKLRPNYNRRGNQTNFRPRNQNFYVNNSPNNENFPKNQNYQQNPNENQSKNQQYVYVNVQLK